MGRLYASFPDHDLAEKAVGALMDHGIEPSAISLIRGGVNEGDFDRTKYNRDLTYGNVTSRDMDTDDNIATGSSNYTGSGSSVSGTAGGVSGGYAPEANRPDAMTTPSTSGDLSNRQDSDYIYNNNPSDSDVNDTHYRAANRLSDSDYTENRVEMDRDRDDDNDDLSAKHGISTTTPADAGAGALKGTGVGLAAGILGALAALFVPGVGIVIGGGALAVALGGVAAATGAGAAAGAVYGYLKDQGVEEHVAAEYSKSIESGNTLIEVDVPSGGVSETEAREVLEKYGALSVRSSTGGYMA